MPSLLSGLDRWLSPAPDPARVGWLKGVTYAHRGLHGAGSAENSPSAFTAAIEAGLGIECDVRLSADGHAIVFHDHDLDRLTDRTGPLALRTMAELGQIALPPAPEDTIPPLAVLLARIAGRTPLLIELKTDREEPVAPLCRAVLRDTDGYHGLYAVMSFDSRVSRWFSRNAPGVVRGLVISETHGDGSNPRASLWHARPDFLAYDVRDLPSAFAAAQRARGLPVLTWTVSSPELRQLAQNHADGPIAEAAGVSSQT
ncbi:MAG TPA: glycerophosphodiester phosphodiesterase family protein [Croceibacterium sp.]|nr:glycerophosphodiester phosphodiesterase family protein [Croceibacterium sp.]